MLLTPASFDPRSLGCCCRAWIATSGHIECSGPTLDERLDGIDLIWLTWPIWRPADLATACSRHGDRPLGLSNSCGPAATTEHQ